MTDLHLTRLPRKQKRLLATLERVMGTIPGDQRFTEPQINDYLRPIYADYAMLRRLLIDYHFLARTPDGTAYWRVAPERTV
ncbi:DUF2087 domain-containing protein [Levilactobacillus acidifarinae]|uniref:DUF2087 domain-containing protein n=1 Tax=Levilactobacillus acidifarinae DSM 19394 = JCM 15949 TaxID=1423715 RepID=A0A0R1LP53_9LACO|nr:DUF2087 domain-containing protein [Levilactobacillus acidifarinae]KRK94593.1 hypothetical protein FD25_GL000563 [Levilactobacillus acidifarinae DSM 19394]GEO68345.1 hypothetical protein LAC03_02550 [Levilactobacillus acidifarinae]